MILDIVVSLMNSEVLCCDTQLYFVLLHLLKCPPSKWQYLLVRRYPCVLISWSWSFCFDGHLRWNWQNSLQRGVHPYMTPFFEILSISQIKIYGHTWPHTTITALLTMSCGVLIHPYLETGRWMSYCGSIESRQIHDLTVLLTASVQYSGTSWQLLFSNLNCRLYRFQ